MQIFVQSILKPSHPPSYNNNIKIIISNNEIKDITKTIKSLEDSDLLFKGVSKTIQNEAQEQRGEFSRILLGMFLSLYLSMYVCM